ncbi:ribokinase [uncultured Corynebacterium sp.]|uniref:ribokinase n=1 Tax=uncultured Corynebacterium sp. TaxID=159447 RepID=UPI0025EBE0B0|nr:ribokinase [uncultured Corynebacterium sp.]
MKSNPDLSNLSQILTSVMLSPGKVTVVGSLNVDLTVRVEEFPAPGETVPASDLTYGPGGKSSNQAVAASKSGANVAMVGAVGLDAYGSFVQRSLEEAGVDTSRVVARDLPTGTALITVNADGENTIVYSAGANQSVSRADLQAAADVLQPSDVVALGFESPASVVAAAIDVARSGAHASTKTSVRPHSGTSANMNTGTCSNMNTGTSTNVDQNNAPRKNRFKAVDGRGIRRPPQIVLNYSPIIDVDPRLIRGVDIVVVNEIELRALGKRYGSAQLPTQGRGGLVNVAGSKGDEHADAKPADAPTPHDSAEHDPADGMTKEGSASENDLFAIATRIVASMDLRGLIVTLGPEGCFVVESDASSESGDINPTSDAHPTNPIGDDSSRDRTNPINLTNATNTAPITKGVYVQGHSVDAVDSTGCGDCFMGTVAASIASGRGLLDSARLATFVASRAATKQGAQNSYFSAEELADELSHEHAN